MPRQRGRNGLFASYVHLVTRRPQIVLGLTLITLVAAGFFARDVRLDTDYRMFFSKDNPQLLAYEQLQQVFSRDDSIIIGIEPRTGTIFQPAVLKGVRELTQAAQQIPFSLRTDSVANFLDTKGEEEDLLVEELFGEQSSFSPERLAKIRSVSLADPDIAGLLVSRDEKMAVVRITLSLPGGKPEVVFEIERALSQIVQEQQARHPDLIYLKSGNLLAGYSFAAVSVRDMKTLMPLMILIIAVLLYIALRNLVPIALTLATVGASSLAAFGFMGMCGLFLTSSSATAPTIIMTLAIADCVHLISAYQSRLAQGLSGPEALQTALKVNFLPIFLTSFTTAIGFLSLNLSAIPPFRDLGNIVAVGVLAAFIFAVLSVPAAIALIPERFFSGYKQATRPWSIPYVQIFRTYARRICGGFAAAFFIALAAIPALEVDDSVVRYFAESIPFRHDSDRIIEKIGGFDTIEYNLPSGGPGQVISKEYLDTLTSFANYARTLEHVAHVRSVDSIFRKINKSLHAEDPSFYRLPATSSEASQYLLLYELSLPFGRDLTDRISIDKSSSRVSVNLKEATTKEILAVAALLDNWLKKNTPPSMHAQGTGLAVIFANIYSENIKGMIEGTAVALLFITLTLIFSLRSWKIGLLSLIPNVLPLVLTFGIWAAAGGMIDLASSAISMIALGIVVDDTVHFLAKYLHARRDLKKDQEASVVHALTEVSPAMITTSVVLAAGFGVLAFSGFKLNSSMGVLTMICIVFALLADLIFLPALILARPGKTTVRISEPAEERIHAAGE